MIGIKDFLNLFDFVKIVQPQMFIKHSTIDIGQQKLSSDICVPFLSFMLKQFAGI